MGLVVDRRKKEWSGGLRKRAPELGLLGGWAGESLSGKVSPQDRGIQGSVGTGSLLGYSQVEIQ